MKSYRDIKRRLPHEKLYLMNTFEDTVIRSSPGVVNKYYAKKRGGKEFEIDQMSELIQRALMEVNEITKKEYINF